MKKFVLLLFFLNCFTLCTQAEVFVDYVPEGVDTTPITAQQKQTQTPKTTVKQTATTQIPTVKNTTSKEQAPALPAHLKNDANISGTSQKIVKRKAIEVDAGTKFELNTSQAFSDRTQKNKKIKFVTTQSHAAGTLLLPKGTVFTGHVEQSHTPQITSNGGLIKIVIDEVIYQNVSNELQGKILKANGKNVFLNTIKGKRKFWKNTVKNTAWGRRICKKSYNTTSKLSRKGGIFWVLTPFPAIGGTLLLGANSLVAPVVATFQKGDSVSFKAGTHFQIKLTQDAQIYVQESQ